MYLIIYITTEGNLNKSVFDKIGKTPIFINTSRYKVMHYVDLIEASNLAKEEKLG